MEFDEQPVIYKCVETIHQPPKACYGEDIVQTTTLYAAMATWSSKKIRWLKGREGSSPFFPTR